jgi:Trk K+ transport system NAD-binding subunit/tetrahydromethanopterin S-methyltransferase subunit G
MSNNLDYFLICGLGSLGQHCIVALTEFKVKIIAIEQIPNPNWEILNVTDLIETLIIGDCRQNNILIQAKIAQCRAALIVTSSEQVNAETALAIRQLNHQTRIVIRSGKKNLNQLLGQRLENFIAFQPYQLSSNAFALAALSRETLGFFSVDGHWLKVTQHQFNNQERWVNQRCLFELHHRKRHLLAHIRLGESLSNSFYQWQPDALLEVGDTLVYIELTTKLDWDLEQNKLTKDSINYFSLTKIKNFINQKVDNVWQENSQKQIKKVVFFCSILVLILLIIGTILFNLYYPGTSLGSAFYVTAILLLGGYSDLFDTFEPLPFIPWWLQLFALSLTVVGTALVGVLYALLTQAILSSQFEFVKQRPPLSRFNHVIVIGLGGVGQNIASRLQEWQQSIVGISLNNILDRKIEADFPYLTANLDNLNQVLQRANLTNAKSIVVATNDEIVNLEVALMTHNLNPKSNIVIRTRGQRLTQHFTTVLPDATIIGANAVAAEAFAGAAFGENILNLFRWNNQTILVTEYQIETGDTLNGLLLAEFAYGYEVVPILHQKPSYSPQIFPLDDVRLMVGDRLVVLATIEGLRRIEQGQLKLDLKRWQVRIEKALTPDAAFEGANAIARISGCSLILARELMANLPQTLPVFLYQHQAQRLVRELNRSLIKAILIIS